MISQFKRYTPFSCQTVSCDFDITPGFGKTFDLTVPRHGDLIKNMYLRFGISPPTSIPGVTHGFVPSVYMFDRFELTVGDNIIETLYPEFINIYYNTFVDFSKKRGNTYNLGPLYSNRDVDADLPDNADSIIYNTPRNYNMMLPFYFSMKSFQSFPLCALTRQELIVRVYMRDLKNIVQLPEGVFDVRYLQSLEAVQLTHMYMDIEYVFLSNQEFDYYINNPQMYMYTETQQEIHEIVKIQPGETDDDADVTQINNVVRLNFLNPVVEFFIYILQSEKIESNRVDKHERYNLTNGHSIRSVNLTLDGETYIDENIADSVFMSQVQYILNHSSVFEHNTTTNNMYVYNYSFSERPEDCCPSGTVNFNIIKNKILKVNLPDVTADVGRTLFVLARSVNILKIENGTAEVLFKNVIYN